MGTPFEIEQGDKPAGQAKKLHPRMDYVAEAGLLREALQSASPMFEQRAEDGMRFRIYKIGSLQVRTTQEHNGEEAIGMVFSTRAPEQPAAHGQPVQRVKEHEKVV